jgi:chemotaxis protein MotB
MKKTLYIFLSLSLFLGFILMSCGPSKRLLVSEAKNEALQKDHAGTIKMLDECNLHTDKLNGERQLLLLENAGYKDDLKFLSQESEMSMANQDKQLKRLLHIIQLQKESMENIKNSISTALLAFDSEDLSVFLKEGKVYVSLDESLLFKSGSDVVDSNGKEVLGSLAKVLNSIKDIEVMVEGHTDNIPVKTAKYKDNWDLSTARATSIVRILTNNYGFDPYRIRASGGGKYHPLNTNSDEYGRSANRRTEIIITPDLKELYSLTSY